MISVQEVESRVLEAIVSGDGEVFKALKSQLVYIQERRRTFSGAGFVSRFIISEDAEALPGRGSFYIGDVSGQTSALLHGFGSLLFVDSGLVRALEIYTYGEVWPDCLPDLTLTYDHPDTRQGIEGMDR